MSGPQAESCAVGRFAPSPTGDLHFGSLLAAVASYLQAKSSSGKWLLRVEDIDPPREVVGSTKRICADLFRLEMHPDEPVLFQSDRISVYEKVCNQLISSNQAYWCGCSRKDLPASGVYPGTCRNGMAKGKTPRAIRIKVSSTPICFHDGLQGTITDELSSSVGDFVIRRADGLIAYQLAVVIDDAFQGVTEVVRGADLLDSTARQIWLQTCLGLPVPDYFHIPVAVDNRGDKLSKRTESDPIRNEASVLALRKALEFLGHLAPRTSLKETWEWALCNWSLDNVPKKHAICLPLDKE